MSQANRGIIDSSSRVLEELMLKTTFKDNLRALLNNLDPENGRQLVRVALERDIEVPLSIVSVLPAVANALIIMADELVRQVSEKFTPPLLQAFAESLLSEIDHKTLAQLIQNARLLVKDISPAFQEALKSLEQERAA